MSDGEGKGRGGGGRVGGTFTLLLETSVPWFRTKVETLCQRKKSHLKLWRSCLRDTIPLRAVSRVYYCCKKKENSKAVKSKAKQLQWATVWTNVNNTMDQWELEANARDQRQARENPCGKVTVGLVLKSDWLTLGGGSFVNRSRWLEANRSRLPLFIQPANCTAYCFAIIHITFLNSYGMDCTWQKYGLHFSSFSLVILLIFLTYTTVMFLCPLERIL